MSECIDTVNRFLGSVLNFFVTPTVLRSEDSQSLLCWYKLELFLEARLYLCLSRSQGPRQGSRAKVT